MGSSQDDSDKEKKILTPSFRSHLSCRKEESVMVTIGDFSLRNS